MKTKSNKNKSYNRRSIGSIGSQDDIKTISKKKIPKKVKEEVWVSNFGYKYTSKCYIEWCSNKINVFNFRWTRCSRK